jgi:site-specific DNA-methyltransferase (adenine-specific)
MQNDNNWQNKLYTGDNLYILNGMNSESVDLIYLDPPFNSKRTYSAPIGSKAAGASFDDMWTWEDVDKAYLERLANDYPALTEFIESIGKINGKSMMSYITYMVQRLIEMHRILKSTGSFYLHCDPTASHYLKIVLDEIFGKSNFRNEIVWQRMVGAKGSQFKPKKYGASSDVILFYVKSDDAYFDIYAVSELSEADKIKKFPLIDEKTSRRYYNDSAHIWCNPSMGDRPNLCYEWRGFTNPHASGWRLSKERLEEEYQKGNIVIRPNGKLERRKYEDDYRGETLNNVWSDIPIVRGKEATGYPTQKPLALLERIIKASCPSGGIVLDPFCGCATTCVAAEKLERRWIGVDIEQQAAKVVMERLKDEEGHLFSNFINPQTLPHRTDVERIEPYKASVKERLFEQQKGHCNGCNVKLDIWHFEIDHIIPKARGGGDYYENYQLLCSICNKMKGDRPMDYLRMKIRKREELMRDKIAFGE